MTTHHNSEQDTINSRPVAVRSEPAFAFKEQEHILRAATFAALVCLLLTGVCHSAEQEPKAVDNKSLLSDSEIAETILRRTHPIRLDPANGIPLVCEVGTEIINLIGIDEAQETYTVDLYSWVTWSDKRLQFDPAEFGVKEVVISPQQVWQNDSSETDSSGSLGTGSERLWNPYLEFMNLVDAKVTEQALRVEASGKCRLTIRQTGTFKFEPNEATFRKFPFDHQDLTISIESFRWNCNQVRFATSNEDQLIFKSELAHIRLAEWKVTGGHTRTREIKYSGDSAPFSRVSTTITVKRQPQFYIWKVCLPLLILVVIALSAPWIPHTKLESRLVLSITTLVAITTYSIVINSELPKMPYLTVMDAWMLSCFLISALGALQNVVVTSLASSGKEQVSCAVDYHTRWILPCLFAVTTMVILLFMA